MGEAADKKAEELLEELRRACRGALATGTDGYRMGVWVCEQLARLEMMIRKVKLDS